MKNQKTIFKASKLALLIAILGGGLTACQSSTSTTDTEDYRTENSKQETASYERQPEQQRGDADKLYNDPDGNEYNKQYNNESFSMAEPPVETTVHFAFDSAELSSSARNALQEINEKLSEEDYQDLHVMISGYADAVGDRNYNQDLSKRRAQSVKDYLQYSSAEIAEVEVKGYGESSPVMDNDTRQGRRQNRRVEISFKTDESDESYTMK